jgi:hypothetical protein
MDDVDRLKPECFVQFHRSFKYSRRFKKDPRIPEFASSGDGPVQQLAAKSSSANFFGEVHFPQLNGGMIDRPKPVCAEKPPLCVLDHLENASAIEVFTLDICEVGIRRSRVKFEAKFSKHS